MTNLQSRFVDEYLVDCCARDAARRAGYSERTAAVKGSQILALPHVQEAIMERRKALSEKTEVSAARVIREYCRLAFLDIRKAFNADGSLKNIHELDDDTAAAVASLEVEETVDESGTKTVRIAKTKMSDKVRALDALAKHLGLFKDADVTQLVQQTQYKVYIGFDPREV